MKNFLIALCAVVATPVVACGPNYLLPIINWYEPNKTLLSCGENFYEENPFAIYKRGVENKEIQKHFLRSYEKLEFQPKYTEAQKKSHAQFRKNLRKQCEDEGALTEQIIEKFKNIPTGIPAEIFHYEIGALKYSKGYKIEAIEDFQKVLSLPKNERLSKTIPAAFMIMRCLQKDNFCEHIDSKKVIIAYNNLIEQIKQGFLDNQKLAFEADGYLAMQYYNSGEYIKALQIYLDQYNVDSKHENVETSIAMSLSKALNTQIIDLAKDSYLAELTTAYLLNREPSRVKSWFDILCVIEKNAANKFNWKKWAGKFALTFYNRGDFTSAKKVIQLGDSNEPLLRWVNAKLMIMQGDIDKASETIAELIKNFSSKLPIVNDDEVARNVGSFKFPNGFYIGKTPRSIPIFENKKPLHAKLISEYGLIKFDKGDYFSALDCFLNAGYYLDAAFLCEVILSLDELKNYADTHVSPHTQEADFIYSILSLRIFRETNSLETARKYYKGVNPKYVEYVSMMKSLDNAIQTTLSSTSSSREKSIAHWQIFTIICNGASDYFASYFNPNDAILYEDKKQDEIYFTSFCNSLHSEDANTLTSKKIKQIKSEYNIHKNYMYLAFEHAVKGADLMDDILLASRMYVSSAFKLKYRDPKYVDCAFKKLVNRCPNTPLAIEAKKINWFPKQIENPNVILLELKK